MKRLFIFLIPVLIGVVVFFGIRSRVPQVEVAQVQKGPALDAVSGNVEILPVLETFVKAERGGIIESVITLPTDSVVAVSVGATLATLDTEQIESEIELAQLQLEAAEARLTTPTEFDLQKTRLEEEFASLKNLKSTGSVAENEMARTRSEIERLTVLANAEQARREQEVVLLKNQLAKRKLWDRQHTIVASTPGRLNEVYVFPGDIVYTGSQIAKIHSHELLIQVSVREEDFIGITIGNMVQVRFLAHGNREFSGTVSGLSPIADADSRQRDVFVTLENPPEGLVAGMTGQAVVVKAERADTLTIPRRALVGEYVYVVESDRVNLRKVETGFVGLHVAEILEGLDLGESIIVDRPHLYRDGEHVRQVSLD
ncbi:MAG: efflux RND transporter periplasmic adaptor subunit [Verrucomicrobiota bacterium]